MRLVAEELIRTGFEPVRTMNWPISATVRHYCMLFRKPKASAESTPPDLPRKRVLGVFAATHCRARPQAPQN